MKKFLVTMGLVAFAVVGCDDSSSASVGPNDEPGIESSSSSCGKVTEPAEVTSSSSSVDTISSSSLQGDKNSSSSGQNEASSSSLKSESSSSDENSQSSSSKEVSSSSSEPESSSEISMNSSTAAPCNVDGENNCNYGTLTDSRDGQTYKTVTIGTQTWMAQNLNYAYTGVPYNYSGYTSDSTSWCYNNDPDNCAKYGRLYTWGAAMDSVGTWSTNGKGCGLGSTCSPTGTIRGICPEGWHLPDTKEWETLFSAVGGKSTAGTALKSTSGWYEDEGESGNGTDSFGFSALPAGYGDYTGFYLYEGKDAYFWSSTERISDFAYNMYLYNYGDYAGLYNYNKSYGFSVRCLKD